MNSQRNLLQMPKVAMKRILEECDFCSIYSLRKVCHSLRDTIDDIKPETHVTYIQVLSQLDAVTVDLDFKGGIQEQFRIIYKFQEIGCLVQCGERQNVLEDRNYQEAAKIDIESILSHKKTELETLNLQFFPKCTLHPKDFSFFEIFKKISNSSKSLFRVQTLSTNGLTQDYIMQILPYLKPKVLKKLSMANNVILKIGQFEELEQWKHLEEFHKMYGKVAEEDFLKLARIPRVRTGVETLSTTGIELVKEAFTTSLTTPEWLELYCFAPDVITNITKSFGEPVIVEPIIALRLADEIGPITYTRWFHPIPGSDDDVIFINHSVSVVVFKRIKASDVAELSVGRRIGRDDDEYPI